jgi:hypothetical protein
MGSINEMTSVRLMLVSSDIEIIDNFCRLAPTIAIHVETCCDAESAVRKLCNRKYEGIAVDLEAEGGPELLKTIRTLTSNKSAVSFAILPAAQNSGKQAQAAANFALQRPLQPVAILRLLKASYPLMVGEKRRYFRYPLQTSVFVTRGSDQEFAVTSLNISEAGICLNSPVSMQVGDTIHLRLCLPGETTFLNLKGEVCWSVAAGRVGIQFVGIPSHVAQVLRAWLEERMEEALSSLPDQMPVSG